jgi:hypothetical protein
VGNSCEYWFCCTYFYRYVWSENDWLVIDNARRGLWSNDCQSGSPQSFMFADLIFIYLYRLFAPVLVELLFRGIDMGKVFGKDSIVGLLR